MDRGQQITRQWKILRLLEHSHQGKTTKEIYEEVGENVEKRTIYRDIEHLQFAGFPLTQDDENRWKLLVSGTVPAISISPSQMLALQLVSKLLHSATNHWLGGPIEELAASLKQQVPEKVRNYCREFTEELTAVSVKEPLHVNSDGKGQAMDSVVEKALANRCQLRMKYSSSKGEMSQRTVEPYATWFADGRTYFVAFCHERKEYRTFAMQRVISAELLKTTFERNQDFSINDFVQAGFGVYHDPPQRVVLRFDEDVAYVPRERQLHTTQQLAECHDGEVEVTMEVGGMRELAAWIVSFGGRVRVLEPQGLINEVLNRYRAGLQAQGYNDA